MKTQQVIRNIMLALAIIAALSVVDASVFVGGNSFSGGKTIERAKVMEKINLTFNSVNSLAVTELEKKDTLYNPLSITQVVQSFEEKVLPAMLKSWALQLEYDRAHGTFVTAEAVMAVLKEYCADKGYKGVLISDESNTGDPLIYLVRYEVPEAWMPGESSFTRQCGFVRLSFDPEDSNTKVFETKKGGIYFYKVLAQETGIGNKPVAMALA